MIEPLRDLFAAIFFLFFAFQIDPAKLPAAMIPALALLVVTAAGKLGSGWVAAGRAGVGRRGRLRAGTTLVARGEFSIVIASLAVGLDEEPELATLAAAYVLLTAVVGPLLAKNSELLDGVIPGRRRKSPPEVRTADV